MKEELMRPTQFFKVLAVAFALLISSPEISNASEKEYSKLLAALIGKPGKELGAAIEGVYQISDFFEYKDIAQKAMKDLEGGKKTEALKPPGGTSLKKSLKKVRKAVDKIKLFEERGSDAPKDISFDQEPKRRRKCFSTMVDLVEHLAKRLEALSVMTNELKKVKGDVKKVGDAARLLSKEFQKLSGTGIDAVLGDVFGWSVYDLEVHYIPGVNKIKSSVNKKIKEFQKEGKKRKKGTENLSSNISMLLESEIKSLTKAGKNILLQESKADLSRAKKLLKRIQKISFN